jgi:hypothetical protein
MRVIYLKSAFIAFCGMRSGNYEQDCSMQFVRTIQNVKWKSVVLFMILLLLTMKTLLNVSAAFCVPED